MTEFIDKFIIYRNVKGYTKKNTLNFLKNLKESNAYISGEFVSYILNNDEKVDDFYMNIFINYRNYLSFVILNQTEIISQQLFFENYNNNIFVGIQICHIGRFDASFQSTKKIYYNIYIVPDDETIVDYIKRKSILTISEIWFYDNKVEGTNLELSKQKKCYLKEEYLNLLIDNLDKKIISIVRKYNNKGIEIIIPMSKYIKKDIVKDKNIEKICIVSFLRNFIRSTVVLGDYIKDDTVSKYPDITRIYHSLIKDLHYILTISKDTDYNIEKLFTSFGENYNIKPENFIEIINKLIERIQVEDDRRRNTFKKRKYYLSKLSVLIDDYLKK